MEKFYRQALENDKKDELSGFRYNFVDDENLIYLDGNSLGKLPVRTRELMSDVIKGQWGKRLIRSWNENWMDLSSKVAGKIAKIVGAREDEIFVGDSTSLNLYKLAFSALKANSGRQKIISDELNFPTDLYVLQGLVDQHFQKHNIKLLTSEDGITIEDHHLQEELDDDTALLSLSHVAFRSSFMYDMKRVNEMAMDKEIYVVWDLSHAAGAVPVNLNDTGADMAVGCTYKYLNGGPGAPAFLYVRKDLQEKLVNPIWAWFAHEKPFDFDLNFSADPGIQKFAIGTPAVLSLSAIEPGCDLILQAGMDRLRKKSLKQSRFLINMIKELLSPLGFRLATPLDNDLRGSHVTVQHPDGYRINRAMIEPEPDVMPVIPDFRPPNNIRLGIAPLYNSFMDLYYTVERIKQIVETREYERFNEERLTVT